MKQKAHCKGRFITNLRTLWASSGNILPNILWLKKTLSLIDNRLEYKEKKILLIRYFLKSHVSSFHYYCLAHSSPHHLTPYTTTHFPPTTIPLCPLPLSFNFASLKWVWFDYNNWGITCLHCTITKESGAFKCTTNEKCDNHEVGLGEGERERWSGHRANYILNVN